MKPLHYVILAMLLAAGFAGSLLLVPNESELALMYFRSRQYSDARPFLEKRYAAGERSVDVVMPLAEVYVQDGEVERAVQLLRQLQASDSDRVALFQQISVFQKYNEQMQDYLGTLESISRMAVSEESLRELADQYRYANDNMKLIPALQTLTARYKGDPDEYLELTNLLAAGSRFREAVDVMRRFETRHAAAVSAESTELFVSVLLDSGEPGQALEVAARWLEKHRDSDSVVRFASLLRTRGLPEYSVKLLTPFDKAIDGDPSLLGEWVEEKTAAGKTSEAFDRLERFRRAKPLSEGLIVPYVNLALEKGDLSRAVEAAQQYGLIRLDDAVLAMIVERAFTADQPVIASRVVLAAGSGFADSHPLLAARVALARGDWADAGRRLQAAENLPSLSIEDRVKAASLDVSLTRPLEAEAQLSRIPIQSASDSLLLEVSRLYITIGRSAEGAQRFDQLRAGKSTFPVAEAWAMLAAASGRGDEVARWLSAVPANLVPEAFLNDLNYIAQDHNQTGLAAAVAERLYLERPTDKYRMQAARALVADGKPAAALPHLRALLKSREPEAEETYTAALVSAVHAPAGAATEALRRELRSFWAGKIGENQPDESKQLDLVYGLLDLGAWDDVLPQLKVLARHREELGPLFVETAIKAGKRNEAIEFLKADLTRTDLPEETREARIYALLDSGGPIEALPYMRQLASEGRGNWGSAYEEALNKLGRNSELLEFWSTRLTSPNSSPEERRGIAWKLVDQGKPEWARSVFGELAGTAPPASSDVAEWLFLWGSSPPQEVLDSLELRARRATAVERLGWLNRLLETGGADRILAVIAANPPATGSGGELFDLYVRALAARNEMAAMSDAISRESAATGSADRVRQLAVMARELGGVSAAGPAYQRLAELLPSDPESLHWLGIRDYTRAHYSSAERRLSSLLTSVEGQYDDSFYLAEILWRAGKRTQARIYYGRAMRMVERMQSPPPEARVAHAQALFRSGYMQQALHEFRRMIGEQPRNGELRADYAALLLEAGKYNEADDVLTSEVESGETRVALLRIQLLSSTGHMPEAMSLIQSLAAEDSPSRVSNASVSAMFATIAQSAGRNRMAEDLIGRAAGRDPENEDYAAELAAIRKDRGTEFRIENESQQIHGLQSENIVRMTSRTVISRALRALISVEQNQVSVRSVQRVDGTVGSYAGSLRRVEAGLDWESLGGTLVQGSLFSSGGPVGGGVAVSQSDLHGATSASFVYGKPDWDFAQSLIQGGTRDRIELKRDSRLGSRVTTELAVAANRYDLPGIARAAQSVAVSGNATLTLLPNPHVSAVYTLDGEYLTSVRALESASGASYRPLPLVSREVHTGAVQIDKQIVRGLHATGTAGFSYDRLGGTAPSINGSLTYERLRHLGAKIDYDRRLYRYGSNQISTTVRAGVFWIF